MSTGAIIALCVVGAVLVLFLLPTAVLSYILYRTLLVRTGPDKWGRSCSLPADEEYIRMYDLSVAWREKYRDHIKEVSVVSDGFRLAGEYYDFGYDRAVIIIPGRMEACEYCCFFAEPYRVGGYNILTIDNRSHGLSEGRVCSLGFKEYRDLIQWSRLLHDQMGARSVIFHGICIGASGALFACTSPDCPDYVEGMVAEGMYTTFSESFKNHMIEDHHPLFPIYYAAMVQIRIFSGANVVTDGPIRRIGQLKKPILFLHSREDTFSMPDKAVALYDKCTAPKRLAWFDKGMHSRIRINAPEAYDAAIQDFLHSGLPAPERV